MQAFFFICFGVGVGYAGISFLLGEVVDFFDFDGDFEFGSNVSPLKPVVIAAFLTVFGGSGLLLLRSFDDWLTLTGAAFLGLAVSFLIYRYVIVPLYKAQNTGAVEKQALIGLNAKVTEFIPQGQYGKITYYVEGNTYSAPAKSEDGGEIPRNSNVEIVYIEKNTFYVRSKHTDKR